MTEIIHFSHANGFPADSYRKLFQHLAPEYEVSYINTLGHNPRYPVSDCWPNLIDETVRFMEQCYGGQPVYAVGHSLGGFLSFLAAIRRPELFRGIVLLDSPILGHLSSTSLWLGKRFGFIDRLTPGRGTLTRRREWASQIEAYRHFAAKPMFARFDPDCLRDYVERGTVPAGDKVRLLFQPEIEYKIYVGLPHDFPGYRGQLKVPTGFIGGRQSTTFTRFDVAHMRRSFGIRCQFVDGGHLYPLERPEAAAAAIRAMLPTLQAS